jgi:photosystem II stability/assembly factor-like uncharacterized protein
MPDLDGELAALRAELRESVRQPPVVDVANRSRQRTSRRRRQFGAAAAVLLVGAAIPLMRTVLQPVPDDGLVPPAATTTSEPGVYRPDRIVTMAEFADQRHGYALRADCVAGTNYGDCEMELLATDDGEHWERRTLPDWSTLGWANQIRILGTQALILDISDVSAKVERYHSGDGGRTWRTVTQDPERSVAAIPPDAILDFRCIPAERTCVPMDQLYLILPDGTTATLTNPPPLTDRFPGQIPLPDGSWWVSGKDPATGRWALAVSRDAGRTWSVSDLPRFEGTPDYGFTVVAGPDRLYASTIGELPEPRRGNRPPHGLLALFTSTDGGKTWVVANEAPVDQLDGYSGSLIAAADGRLYVVGPPGLPYVSTDNGKSFTRAVDSAVSGSVWSSRGGYFASRSHIGPYLYSADGVHWRELNFG